MHRYPPQDLTAVYRAIAERRDTATLWSYRNVRYLHFGWAAARLDDLLNYLPARLTALTYALMGDAPRALRCWRSQDVLTRLFPDPPSLRFGLPGTEQDWMRLEAALAVPYTGAWSR